MVTVETIAQMCHETNRIYCISLGDYSQHEWNSAPEWQRISAISGVLAQRANPDMTPQMSHESWLEEKRKDGWVYGIQKNEGMKTHPCYVLYEKLSEDQKLKDTIFSGICKLLIPYIKEANE